MDTPSSDEEEDVLLSDLDTSYAVLSMAKDEVIEELWCIGLKWEKKEDVECALDLHKEIEILDKARSIIEEYVDPRVILKES